METIQTLQLLATMLSTLLLLVSYSVPSYSKPLRWTSVALVGMYAVSLLITQPPPGAYSLALQVAFPAMSAELAYQVSTILIAPIVGALVYIALRLVWPGLALSSAWRWPSRLLLLVAHVGLIQLLLVLCLGLASCKPKPAQAPAAPTPVPAIDSTRQTLQQQADTSRAHANRAGQSAKSSVTEYETDAKTYDSLRNPLP